MAKSFFKIFFSKSRENKWLNQLGKSGLLLEKITDSKYVFSTNKDKKYSYSIEYIDCPPDSEKGTALIEEYKTRNIVPVVTSGNWIYFVSDNCEITQSKKVLRKNSIPYLWRSIYLLFFAICGAVVCGYQFFAIDYLDRIKHISDGVISHFEIDSSGTAFDKILTLIVKPVNVVIDFINNYYLSFLTDAFGVNDAVVVIGMLLPIVIVLTAIGAFNMSEFFIYFTRFSKKLRVKN